MAFVRIKTVQRNKYAYLVENKWTNKGARQSCRKYIGRVFSLEKVSDCSERIDIPKGNNKKELLEYILALTLKEHGFTQKESVFKHKSLIVDINKLEVMQKNGKPAAIALNEGILCTETLSRIITSEKSEEETEGYSLAKCCVEAGLSVPEKLFIALYESTQKDMPTGA